MGLVVDQLKVLKDERVDVFDLRIELHRGKGEWFAGQLLASLIEMIGVKVEIAKAVDESLCTLNGRNLEILTLKGSGGVNGGNSDARETFPKSRPQFKATAPTLYLHVRI